MSSPPVNARASLEPDDRPPQAIGWTIPAALFAAGLFEVFSLVTKQIEPIYAQVPWAEDPYDTFVSFALFFVPFAGLVAGARLLLRRPGERLPPARLIGIVRATRLALIVSLATLAADWAGTLSGGRVAPEGFIAGAARLALAFTSAVVLAGTIVIARIPLPRAVAEEPDGLADGLALLRAMAPHLGPLDHSLAAVSTYAERHFAPLIRRHPIRTAALLALGFGVALALSAAREASAAAIVGLVGVVGACAMFAFLIIGGSWLGLVASPPASVGQSRLLRAAVAGAAAVPLSLAFREVIWSAVGFTGKHDLAALALLVVLAGLVTFSAALLASAFRRP